MERLADPFGKLGPDVRADERRRVAVEHPAGVRVHVRVAPIGVERDEPVARCLEDARQRLTRLLCLTAPADELSDQRPNAGVKREDLAVGTGRGVRELLLEPREALVERRVHLRGAAVVTFNVRMPPARCTRPAILYVPRSVALIARRVVRSVVHVLPPPPFRATSHVAGRTVTLRRCAGAASPVRAIAGPDPVWRRRPHHVEAHVSPAISAPAVA